MHILCKPKPNNIKYKIQNLGEYEIVGTKKPHLIKCTFPMVIL